MLRRLPAFAALVALLISIPALPQTAVQDTNDRMQAATRLARTLNPEETYRERLRTLYASMTPMFAQAAQQGALPPDFGERMAKVMDEVMPYETFIRIFADEYAQRFSVEELTEILRFYNSPTGAKMLNVSTDIGVDFMKRMSTEIMPKMQDAMRRQGLIK
jgi:hypothetical protein